MRIVAESINRNLYLTLDNGGLPFVVDVDDHSIRLYKYTMAYDNVEKVFDGGGSKGDKDSAMLLKLGKGNKYAFIGTVVYEFKADDEIENFYAPIGNSAVPYPIAVGKENIYFMLDKVYVDKKEFEDVLKKSDRKKDLYGTFFDNQKTLKTHKLKEVDDVIEKVLEEGTSNYWPGYSDDGTADWLGSIRKKTSVRQNKELKKAEKRILQPKSDAYYNKWDFTSKEKDYFWSRWQVANMITTSLQDGFYINPSVFDKALKYYKEVLELARKNKGDIFNNKWKDSRNYFINSVKLIIRAMEKENPMGRGHNYYYSPGFLKDDDRDFGDIRKSIDRRAEEREQEIRKTTDDMKISKEQLKEFINSELKSVMSENYPAGAQNDPSAPWNQEDKTKEGIRAKESRFNTTYFDGEFAILKDKDTGSPYAIFVDGLDKDELSDYADKEEIFNGYDEDGMPDVDYGDWDVDGDVIENYVNDNIRNLNFGIGLSDWEDGDKDMVEINDELRQDFVGISNYIKEPNKKAQFLNAIGFGNSQSLDETRKMIREALSEILTHSNSPEQEEEELRKQVRFELRRKAGGWDFSGEKQKLNESDYPDFNSMKKDWEAQGYSVEQGFIQHPNKDGNGNLIYFQGPKGDFHVRGMGVYIPPGQLNESDYPDFDKMKSDWEQKGFSVNGYHNSGYITNSEDKVGTQVYFRGPKGELQVRDMGATAPPDFKHKIDEGVASTNLKKKVLGDFSRMENMLTQIGYAVGSNPEFGAEDKVELKNHLDAIKSEMHAHLSEFNDLFDSAEEYYDENGYEGLEEGGKKKKKRKKKSKTPVMKHPASSFWYLGGFASGGDGGGVGGDGGGAGA